MPNPHTRLNLATATFNPAVFTPQVFTPQQVDMNLLARSFDKMEEREEKLATQKLALNEAFSKARELLPDNAETNQYITDNQNRIKESINAMIDAGDMSGALTTSKNLAGDFISSPEYNARVKEHKQRKEWLEQLNSLSLDNYIKEYYRDTYQDRNNFTRDANGNITGTAGWEAPLPEQGQSATAIIEQAIKLTRDERTDRASSFSTSGPSGGSGGHSAYKREILTADKLANTAQSIINDNPRVKQAFVDQYNAGMHQIKKLTEALKGTTDPTRKAELENQITSYKSTFYKNNAPIDSADTYIKNIFSPDNSEIANAAYDYEHTDSGSTSSTATPSDEQNKRSLLGKYADLKAQASAIAETMHGTNQRTQASASSVPARGGRSNLRPIK